MPKKKVPLASDRPAAQTEAPDMIVGTRWVKPGRKEEPKVAAPAPKPKAPPRPSPAARKIEAMGARIAELEDALLQRELDESGQAFSARIKRLERDVTTYREARAAAEFIVTDLRTALDHAEDALARLKVSPAFRLGTLLLAAAGNWRAIVKLPSSLTQWASDNRRVKEDAAAQLISDGSATDFTAPVEKALELAEKQSLQHAERWVLDQRLGDQVNARVLSDLATFARSREPQEAVRLAEASLEADPNESRVKRLAFLMADAGSVTQAAQMLRSAIEKGAAFNRTEEVRATDILALADLALTGLVLIPKRGGASPAAAAGHRVMIFAPQAYPFHWTSASIRAHAMAMALAQAGIAADIVTAPGYPNVGRRTPIETPPTRTIDGVTYHILPATEAGPGFGQAYLAETSRLILAKMKALSASVLIAPSDVVHGYPAAMAAQVAGVSLVLDCVSTALDEANCHTERAQVLSRVEAQLLAYAQVILARTTAIAARLQNVAPEARLCLLPDATPQIGANESTKPRPDDGAFVFGYVGDNAPDIDIEGLGVMLNRLVGAGVDARLVIYSVGGRIQAIRNQLELEGLGDRVKVVEKSPPGRRLAAAFSDLDVVVVPCRTLQDALRSPFQILSALRHHKCVVALGAAEHDDLFGAAVVHAQDTESAVQALCELAKDTDRRRYQEAEARSWDERHPSGSLLAQTIAAL